MDDRPSGIVNPLSHPCYPMRPLSSHAPSVIPSPSTSLRINSAEGSLPFVEIEIPRLRYRFARNDKNKNPLLTKERVERSEG